MSKLVSMLFFASTLWLALPLASARADTFDGYVCRVNVDGSGTANIYITPAAHCTGTVTPYWFTASGTNATATFFAVLTMFTDAVGTQTHVTGTFGTVFGVHIISNVTFSAT